MASRKEEKERLREERLAAQKRQKSSEQTRQRLAMVGAGVILLAVVVGLVVVIAGSGGGDTKKSGKVTYSEASHIQFNSGNPNDIPGDDRTGTPPPELKIGNLQAAAKKANCDLKLDLPDEGNTHIGPPKEAEKNLPDYKTNPPTSGDHVDPGYQQADGAYTEYPSPVLTVHSLEHGRIDIQYSPDLAEKDQLALKGVFDDSPDGMLLFPNPDMPYEVAATAWTQMIGCDSYEGDATLDAIRDFRDTYRGRGPEAIPIDTGG
jgi:hypothetical protein